jgi:multiple sugar transport system permease protein
MPRDAAALDGPASAALPRRRNYARRYAWFVVPAAVVVIAVIVFPWAFTLYVSAFDWRLGGERHWVG